MWYRAVHIIIGLFRHYDFLELGESFVGVTGKATQGIYSIFACNACGGIKYKFIE